MAYLGKRKKLDLLQASVPVLRIKYTKRTTTLATTEDPQLAEQSIEENNFSLSSLSERSITERNQTQEDLSRNDQPSRVYLYRDDLFTLFNDFSFLENFGLSKQHFQIILDRIKNMLVGPRTHACTALKPQTKFGIFLHYAKGGGVQRIESTQEGFRVSQSTISRAVNDLSHVLSSFYDEFVVAPETPEELEQLAIEFFEEYGLPCIVGISDGTHVETKKPPKSWPIHPDSFINRKGYCSFNALVTVDATRRIIHLSTMNEGSCHDSPLLNQSTIFEKLQDLFDPESPRMLAGDSGFASSRVTLVPYPDHIPKTAAQTKFNRAFKKMRVRGEHVIADWKRWNLIRMGLRSQSLDNSQAMMCALATLHNWRIDLMRPRQRKRPTQAFKRAMKKVQLPPGSQIPRMGSSMRDQICNKLFS